MNRKRLIVIVFCMVCGFLSAQTIVDSVLYIPEGTTVINDYVYYGNTKFNKVVIPSTVTKIGDLAFHSCKKLKELDIHSSVTTIGNAAFQNALSLSKITLHEGLTNMSYRLFKSAVIKEITIPSTVTEFANEIFPGCDSLTTIKVDKYSEAHAFFSSKYGSKISFTDNAPVQSHDQKLLL